MPAFPIQPLPPADREWVWRFAAVQWGAEIVVALLRRHKAQLGHDLLRLGAEHPI